MTPEYYPMSSNIPTIVRLDHLQASWQVFQFKRRSDGSCLGIESNGHELSPVEVLEEITVGGVVGIIAWEVHFDPL